MTLDKITAPFTPEQVEALNFYQRNGRFHPFTCPSEHRDEGERLLVATEEGWVCGECSYTQDWAWFFMADSLS